MGALCTLLPLGALRSHMRAPIPASIQELSAFFCTCGHLGAFCTLLYLRTSESSMRAPIHCKSSMCFDVCMKAHSLLEIGIGIGIGMTGSGCLFCTSVWVRAHNAAGRIQKSSFPLHPPSPTHTTPTTHKHAFIESKSPKKIRKFTV